MYDLGFIPGSSWLDKTQKRNGVSFLNCEACMRKRFEEVRVLRGLTKQCTYTSLVSMVAGEPTMQLRTIIF